MDFRTFRLYKNYWDSGDLYTSATHTFDKGLTVLVGCNGSGKSTTITQIKEQLKKDNVPYFSFNNENEGGIHQYHDLINSSRFVELSSLMTSSEGEKIHQNFSIKIENGSLGRALDKARYNNSKEMFILCDAVDSGLSIDTILELKEFFDIVIEDNKERFGIDVYVIASANSYEMAAGENCYDVNHNKYITFTDYEDYKKFILKSRKFKEHRIEKYKAKRKAELEKRRNTNESSNHVGSRCPTGWASR